MEKILVSIIVTVHNSEKYLEECLESVCGQTLNKIEIICVDGGSTDASPSILQKFCEKDARIKIINDTNTSYGHKVNVGIECAVGEYVGILESDDKMKPEMLKKLYNIVEQYHPDVVDASYSRFFEVDGEICSNTVYKYSVENCNQLVSGAENINKTLSANSIWAGIYKRSFLIEKKIRLNESPGASFQDTSFGFLTGILAETKYHLDEPLYCYRIDNVGSSVKDNRKVFEIIGECNYLKEELQKRNITDETIWKLYYKTKYSAYYWNYSRLHEEGKEKFLEKYVEDLQKDIQDKKIYRDMFPENIHRITFGLIDDIEAFKRKEALRIFSSVNAIARIIRQVRDKDIIIFGAGIKGQQAAELLRNYHIVAFCDNALELQGLKKCEIDIISPEKAGNAHPDAAFVIANAKHYQDIKEQLLCMKIPERNIYIYM